MSVFDANKQHKIRLGDIARIIDHISAPIVTKNYLKRMFAGKRSQNSGGQLNKQLKISGMNIHDALEHVKMQRLRPVDPFHMRQFETKLTEHFQKSLAAAPSTKAPDIKFVQRPSVIR